MSYTDSNGLKHMVGLMDVSMDRSPPDNIAGSIVDVRAIGLSVLTSDHRVDIGVGYVRQTTAEFRDNAVAIGPFDHIPAKSDPTNEGKPQ